MTLTELEQLLSADRIRTQVTVSSKKRALELLAELLQSACPATEQNSDVFEALLIRERLGTTGLGRGVAIPHGRLQGITMPVAAIMTIAPAVEFDSIDQLPVDFIWALLVPEDDPQQHIQLLGSIATILRNDEHIGQLRSATSSEDLLQILTKLFT